MDAVERKTEDNNVIFTDNDVYAIIMPPKLMLTKPDRSYRTSVFIVTVTLLKQLLDMQFYMVTWLHQ